ncbi:MAG: SDR family oxidoreductase [Bacteroidales bacterium]|nr:SDR family oxidoreductase [Bacteroidales bacterium]
MTMYNPFSLKDKTVFITGASSGIGKAVAIECSRMGSRLCITGRNAERLNETYMQLEGSGHLQLVADLQSEDAIRSVVDRVPVLDGIVYCAGIARPLPFQFTGKETLEEVMGINFNSPVILSQLLLENKKIKKGASIVFISSVSGVFCSSAGGSIYSASKGAINGLVKGMALDLAPKMIRVNTVNPGMIDTNIFSEGTITQEQLTEDIKRYPLKRFGKPEEVAYSVIYLLSDASSWVTGSSLLIDGGFTLL